MAAVKGSKQYDMVVVPHRPFVKALKVLFALGLIGFSGWFCFEYGKNQGLALKVQVVKERDLIKQELEKSIARIWPSKSTTERALMSVHTDAYHSVGERKQSIFSIFDTFDVT